MATVRKGVTLIELVVVIVITGILAGLGSMVIRQVIVSWNTVSSRSEAAAQMSIALGRMSRQIRSVRDTVSVNSASANGFNFTRRDNMIVAYSVSGTNLLENGIVLSTDVARLNFTYYNFTGSTITNPKVYPQETDISRVGVELEIKSRVKNKTMGIMIRPRNLGG
jgi:prepilin-type N-terminal cleavage/methylation domain-containing protein